jgi:hypothetical protein
MLENLKWQPLEERRMNTRICLLYKAVNGLVAIPVQQYLIPLNKLLYTYLAALLWTLSILSMFSLVYGSQTAEFYSTFGLIKVLTAIALVCCGAFLKFLPSMPWA